jgi:hypothetical protein
MTDAKIPDELVLSSVGPGDPEYSSDLGLLCSLLERHDGFLADIAKTSAWVKQTISTEQERQQPSTQWLTINPPPWLVNLYRGMGTASPLVEKRYEVGIFLHAYEALCRRYERLILTMRKTDNPKHPSDRSEREDALRAMFYFAAMWGRNGIGTPLIVNARVTIRTGLCQATIRPPEHSWGFHREVPYDSTGAEDSFYGSATLRRLRWDERHVDALPPMRHASHAMLVVWSGDAPAKQIVAAVKDRLQVEQYRAIPSYRKFPPKKGTDYAMYFELLKCWHREKLKLPRLTPHAFASRLVGDEAPAIDCASIWASRPASKSKPTIQLDLKRAAALFEPIEPLILPE